MRAIHYLQQWTWIRWIRLLIGGYLLYVAASEMDGLAAAIGGLLILSAVFNAACPGNTCNR
jgi:hypothetical protein